MNAKANTIERQDIITTTLDPCLWNGDVIKYCASVDKALCLLKVKITAFRVQLLYICLSNTNKTSQTSEVGMLQEMAKLRLGDFSVVMEIDHKARGQHLDL